MMREPIGSNPEEIQRQIDQLKVREDIKNLAKIYQGINNI